MSRRLTQGAIAGTTVAMGLALFGPSAFAAAGPDRATVDAAPSWTASAAVVGATSSAQRLHLAAVLNLRNAAGATALADAVSDPASPSYRTFVTAASWRARFAPTSSQVAGVTRWLASQGFTVTAVPANGRLISFDGTAAQAEKAFGTTLKDFTKAGVTVTAPATAVTLPTALAGTVAGITGLDSSEIATPSHIAPAQDAGAVAAVAAQPAAGPGKLPPPGAVFKNAGPCSTYYGEKPATDVPQILKDPLSYAPCGYKPPQVRSAYGMDFALNKGLDGRGATVAVVDAFASPTIRKDAQTYATKNDPGHLLTDNQFSQSLPASYNHIDACGASGWYGEETLDVEAVHAEAPAANILYVGASSCLTGDLDSAVNSIVDNGLADIVTNSYGDVGEPSKGGAASSHQIALQAAAQGVTLTFSSGDSGDEIANTGTRQVDYEASDPYVTAVGGTSLGVGAKGAYLFEQGWGTGKSILTNGAWDPNPPAYVYGGGGGTSKLFTEPAYQKGVVPASISGHFGGRSGRAVPDVSMVGDPSTGFLVGQSQTFPDGSVKYSEYRIGGTSLSSPLFAGVVAVAAQKAGGKLGFLNPSLYKLAGTAAFTDVNHGRAVTDGVVRVDYANAFDASDGLITSLRTFNQTGTIYTRKGYDDVTGVGSPHGLAFLTALAK